MTFTKEIKQKALNLGFVATGITSAAPFRKSYRRLRRLKKNKRLPVFMNSDIKLITHPRAILPGAESIITVALSYYQKIPLQEEAFIARYARIPDYHLLIKDKLKKLAAFINRYNQNNNLKILCDNGPLLERQSARRSGIGWIGKNTCLLNQEYGSFLVLGEIITDLKLEPDQPQESKCNNCQLCLENCPGNALNPKRPYDMQHKQCLSFLSQKRGVLKEKDNLLFENKLWGCDSCQEVCPYNKEVNLNKNQAQTPIIKPNLSVLLSLNHKEELPADWEKTALSWRGTRILIRNALIVSGNCKYNNYFDQLLRLSSSRSPIIKKYARRALNMFN